MSDNEKCLIGAGTPEGPCRLPVDHTGPHQARCGAPGPGGLTCRLHLGHTINLGELSDHQSGNVRWVELTTRSTEPGGTDLVDHPQHYGGADNPYEAIKVIDAWELGFALGNAVKYISRAGKKGDALTDLRKAAWYLNHHIEMLECRDAEA